MNFDLNSTFYCNIMVESNHHLNLLQVGWDKCLPNASYSHYRDMHIVHFIKSGSGTIETNGKKFTLSANDAYLVRPNILTIQTASPDNPWQLYFFAFNGNLAEKIIEKTVFNNSVYVNVKNNHFHKMILDSAIQLNSSPQNQLKKYEHLFKLISFFDISNSDTFNNYNNNSKYDFSYKKDIRKICQYIQLNYPKNITIEELAKSLNISRSQLYRNFKEVTGMSVQDFIVNTRITEAKKLLSISDLSASAISQIVGYAQYTTFFRVFKHHTGLTPIEYRQNKNVIDIS